MHMKAADAFTAHVILRQFPSEVLFAGTSHYYVHLLMRVKRERNHSWESDGQDSF